MQASQAALRRSDISTRLGTRRSFGGVGTTLPVQMQQLRNILHAAPGLHNSDSARPSIPQLSQRQLQQLQQRSQYSQGRPPPLCTASGSGNSVLPRGFLTLLSEVEARLEALKDIPFDDGYNDIPANDPLEDQAMMGTICVSDWLRGRKVSQDLKELWQQLAQQGVDGRNPHDSEQPLEMGAATNIQDEMQILHKDVAALFSQSPAVGARPDNDATAIGLSAQAFTDAIKEGIGAGSTIASALHFAHKHQLQGFLSSAEARLLDLADTDYLMTADYGKVVDLAVLSCSLGLDQLLLRAEAACIAQSQQFAGADAFDSMSSLRDLEEELGTRSLPQGFLLPLWCAICDELSQAMSMEEFFESTSASDPMAVLDANSLLMSQVFPAELLQSWRALIQDGFADISVTHCSQ